jgi:diadenosine tetraphosphate (Ap4A) HIT family hydrolase
MPATNQCPFCHPAGAVLENGLAFALFDKFPVTPGHMLLIPRRHVADWFETTPEERQALFGLADEARALGLRQPDGAAKSRLAPAVILTPDSQAQF